MDNRKENDFYKKLGEDLIKNDTIFSYIKDSSVKIGYLESNYRKTSKGRLVLGQCEKIQDKYKWAIPYDFTITLFNPNLEGLDDKQIKTVVFHELLHVGIKITESGEEIYSVVPHDLEDFKTVIDKYGTEWAKPRKGDNEH